MKKEFPGMPIFVFHNPNGVSTLVIAIPDEYLESTDANWISQLDLFQMGLPVSLAIFRAASCEDAHIKLMEIARQNGIEKVSHIDRNLRETLN